MSSLFDGFPRFVIILSYDIDRMPNVHERSIV